MAVRILPDETWQLIEPLLPKRTCRPQGGRPPIGDREVLTGVLFVLRTGIPWEELPEELGCGCGMTCLRRLRQWQENGIWSQVELILKWRLPSSRCMDWARASRAKQYRQ